MGQSTGEQVYEVFSGLIDPTAAIPPYAKISCPPLPDAH
jgi:hypothetical protein